MMLLGLILAGGQSTRFGSDKALAVYQGRPLLMHAADALAPHVAALAVAGRDWPELIRIQDAPKPGLGPLGGLLGGLIYAGQHGFDAVLTSGCDTLGLMPDHIAALNPGPAVLDTLPVVGLWPTALGPRLAAWMEETPRHALYSFARAVAARRVVLANPPVNINQPSDLDALA
jgi:molybdopterin-guanine dinucleotide biosynthesis protein A